MVTVPVVLYALAAMCLVSFLLTNDDSSTTERAACFMGFLICLLITYLLLTGLSAIAREERAKEPTDQEVVE